MEQKLWFKRKYFGWGWRPVTWQGWGVLVLYIAQLFFVVILVDHYGDPAVAPWTILLGIVPATALMLIICFIKGERPRWSWGFREKVDETSQIQ